MQGREIHIFAHPSAKRKKCPDYRPGQKCPKACSLVFLSPLPLERFFPFSSERPFAPPFAVERNLVVLFFNSGFPRKKNMVLVMLLPFMHADGGGDGDDDGGAIAADVFKASILRVRALLVGATRRGSCT